MNHRRHSYHQLSAESYDLWFPTRPYEDEAFFRTLIATHPSPALEVGCGTGRLLVPFLEECLSVEGVDISEEMLRVCRSKAAEKGVRPVLYCQPMEELALPKQYGVIFIPFGSFMLVKRPDTAVAALQKFFNHLATGGVLAIPLFDPTKTDIAVDAPVSGQWRLRRHQRRADGAEVECWERSLFDMDRKIQTIEYHLKVMKEKKVVQETIETDTLYWYSQAEFAVMLSNAGFQRVECRRGYTDQPATDGDEEYTFLARKL